MGGRGGDKESGFSIGWDSKAVSVCKVKSM